MAAPADLSRFSSLWRAIAAKGDPSPVFHLVQSGYAEEYRHYHNLRHLNECLEELDAVAAHVHDRDALEAALWFHDVIYDPAGTHNELKSADLARDCLIEAGVNQPFIRQVHDLVLITQSHSPGDTPDGNWICDIDLAILGQDDERFDEYESGIRREYAAVPIQLYGKKRAEILTGFLARRQLYLTESFRSRYETAARRNLARSIKRLLSPEFLEQT